MMRVRIICGVLLFLVHFVLIIVVEIVNENGQYVHRVSRYLMAMAGALAAMITKVSLKKKMV